MLICCRDAVTAVKLSVAKPVKSQLAATHSSFAFSFLFCSHQYWHTTHVPITTQAQIYSQYEHSSQCHLLFTSGIWILHSLAPAAGHPIAFQQEETGQSSRSFYKRKNVHTIIGKSKQKNHKLTRPTPPVSIITGSVHRAKSQGKARRGENNCFCTGFTATVNGTLQAAQLLQTSKMTAGESIRRSSWLHYDHLMVPPLRADRCCKLLLRLLSELPR